MHKIIQFDKQLFKLINYNGHNSFFDFIMPWLRNALVWAPLYIFLVFFVLINFKKSGIWWVILAITTAALTDIVSSHLIKENIFRLRPCNDPNITDWIRVLVGYKPQSSSFTSSHAATHFGIATFIFLTLKNIFKNYTFLFFIWAFFISFAQVYVGVHYPIDVTCGAIIGILIGYLSGKSFNKAFDFALIV